MTKHKQVPVYCKRAKKTKEVDEGLAPLLKVLWDNDISTISSCEENKPGIIWICFWSSQDLERFLELAVPYPENLQEDNWYYSRATRQAQLEEDWKYDVLPDNMGVRQRLDGDELIETFVGPNSYILSISLRFPVSDLPLILKRIEKSLIENL